MPSSRISAILRSASELAEPIRVHGATPAARALIAARYAAEGNGRTIVVLCPDDDAAADFLSDLNNLSERVEGKPVLAAHFPTWEQSPYSPITPSIRTRLARVQTLAALMQPETAPRVVVTTLAASCQATLPQEAFRTHSVALEVEESVESREALIRKLLDAGYLRVDPVEDPGTFAVRGDIVDIYPPDRDCPIRVELFGDLIEKIREFDPSSQRTETDERASFKKVRVPPAREVLINLSNSALVRERLKARADDLGITRAVRDPVLASVHEGIYPDHSDGWAPFAYENPSTFWEYAGDCEILWSDELTLLQSWDQFLEEQTRLSEDTIRSGTIMPAVKNLFAWDSARESFIRARSKLYLDRIDVANLETVGAAQEEEQEPGAAPQEPITARHRVFVRNNADLAQGSRHALGELEPKFKLWIRQGFRILTLASTETQLERIRYLLEERGFPCRPNALPEPNLITLAIGTLTEGFRWPAEGIVIITEGEILGAKHLSRRARKSRSETGSAAKDWAGLQALSDLSVGDTVVHVDHGIGRYLGIVRLDLSGAPSDFLQIEYANRDKLYLPVYRLNVIQKYAGAGADVALDRLGGAQFAKAKDKVREAVKKLAVDLIQLYAQRKVTPGVAFSPRDAMFREFEAKFPFDETPDQIKAIDAVLSDMESGKVMDRLVCGDVGYGKTEVAMRAAYRAVSDGKQVVVLVPTTVLAFQHEQSFRARFKDYPISIESISRFKSAKEQKGILESLASGKIDIIVGTHRLLSRDIKFKDLGLIIVDEEHRFGVEHKERLKTLRVNTHVLTLTATPIPRTLQMALSGLRDISLINTPPVDRLPIRTYVSKFDDSLIQRSVEFELNRGGQVFILHNRIQSIQEIAKRVKDLVPHASVGVGHGQMAEGELEKTMVDFYEKRSNVLVCTAIIESGLDVPTANTIIINRADSLGLAQLYQIRGRVGRGQQRAYAYLMIPAEGAVTEDAKRRLEVIQRFVELGSGFSVASHDLEIRGGGDILGPQQSGHIAAVGFDLYMDLLDEAIRELEGKPLSPEQSSREPEIKAPFPAYLAEEYVPDVHQRLSLYRRFSAATQEAELEAMEEELRDRFGPLPAEAINLLWLIRIKQLLKKMGVDSLTVGPERSSLVPGQNSRLDPARAVALVATHPKKYQLTPDSKLVVKISTPNLRDLFFALETLLKELSAKS